MVSELEMEFLKAFLKFISTIIQCTIETYPSFEIGIKAHWFQEKLLENMHVKIFFDGTVEYHGYVK